MPTNTPIGSAKVRSNVMPGCCVRPRRSCRSSPCATAIEDEVRRWAIDPQEERVEGPRSRRRRSAMSSKIAERRPCAPLFEPPPAASPATASSSPAYSRRAADQWRAARQSVLRRGQRQPGASATDLDVPEAAVCWLGEAAERGRWKATVLDRRKPAESMTERPTDRPQLVGALTAWRSR